ncbi:YrdB family protein [Gordonia sp. NPDC003424]
MFYLTGFVVFLAELVAWAGVASLGLLWLGNTLIGWVVSVLLLIVVIGFWSRFMAPKAPHRLQPVPYYVVKAIIYLGAVLAIVQVSRVAAVIFAIVAVVSELAMRRVDTGSDGSPGSHP